ncbi:MAG: hypothetical protein K2Z81_23630 [Cyanobacteria bacterium]|nr:hypothetical protein [Cyanobacteriota bacterium]
MSSESTIEARSSGSSGEYEKNVQHNDRDSGQVLFDRYAISELVSDNGAVLSYTAIDLSNNHPIVVETVKSNEQFASFKKIAGACLALNHENILKALELQVSQTGQPYLIKDLNNLIKLGELISSTGPMEQDVELAHILIQICKGIQYAHENGIPHGALSPDAIYLGEQNGKVAVLIDGFEENHLSLASDSAGLLQQATVQADIRRLSFIAYFLATDELPAGMHYCDDPCDQLALIKSYESLAERRADLGSVDEFIQLLEDAANTDTKLQISSAKEFEDGLMDWVEAARATRKSGISESLSTGENQIMSDRVTKDLTSAVRHMLLLRQKQNVQEQSMVMKISEFADGQGPRRAPVESIGRLLAKGFITCSVLGFVCYASIRWHDEINEVFVSASKQLAGSRQGPEDEIMFEDEVSSKAGKAKERKKTTKSGMPAPGTNDQRGRKNRVAPFNPSSLREIYREGTVTSSNNLGRKNRFRIDYREFKEEWLK